MRSEKSSGECAAATLAGACFLCDSSFPSSPPPFQLTHCSRDSLLYYIGDDGVDPMCLCRAVPRATRGCSSRNKNSRYDMLYNTVAN